MTTSEYALVDTNVLVYAADKTSPFHQIYRNKPVESLNTESYPKLPWAEMGKERCWLSRFLFIRLNSRR